MSVLSPGFSHKQQEPGEVKCQQKGSATCEKTARLLSHKTS